MTKISEQKAALRKSLRQARRDLVASLSTAASMLVLKTPPTPIRALVPEGATVGLYRAVGDEAPAGGYARYFMEAGHPIALPRIDSRDAPMAFHMHTDPYGEHDLAEGPMGLMQPAASTPQLVPQVLFVPLLGFTTKGARIGQGGGFYDRWLAAHPETLAIGLAWDVQLIDKLPLEKHDVPLKAVITPTRLYGPF